MLVGLSGGGIVMKGRVGIQDYSFGIGPQEKQITWSNLLELIFI